MFSEVVVLKVVLTPFATSGVLVALGAVDLACEALVSF